MKTNPETKPMSWTKFQKAGECGCVLCGRPIGSLEVDHLYVHIGQGGASILRADLPTTREDGPVVFADGTVDTGDMGWYPIGSSCAKKIGAAYVKDLRPLARGVQ